MSNLIIRGGNRLNGEVRVQGAKNSALPILAACVAIGGINVIDNCPRLTDVSATVKILSYLGCKVSRDGNTVTVDSSCVNRYDIPRELMHEMRSSIVFLGPLLSRMGRAELYTPGGCEIGLRPVDLHISAMRQMGSDIAEEYGRIACTSEGKLRPANISLSFPSVGTTENIMIAASTAEGTTVITNAAREPEISDLADFLNKCGADIKGAGESTVVINGVKKLHGTYHKIIPDRIVTATYMIGAAVTGGNVTLTDAGPSHLTAVSDIFEKAGCKIRSDMNSINISAPEKLRSAGTVRTMPYPGFPTDIQAPVSVMAAVSLGTTFIIESIFENRFKHIGELNRMGANIKVDGRMAVIEGVEGLRGTKVFSHDLRGGTAMVLAGLAAQGETVVADTEYIDRGCQDIEKDLKTLGADICKENSMHHERQCDF
ncbi:MAG: UDP-N-acetylglucosamine 1-carboxyvinyltransferase [Clostridiales bacterium]|nr:UDP-N-acetylglucosamine 1-carboxyvinyltransferase [Clostridiales bacterium]